MNGETGKKTSGLAIASLICGLFFLIPLLGVIFSLVAISLGTAALVTISKYKESLKGSGLAVTGVVLGGVGIVIIPIMMLIAAIAIPNFLRARSMANEYMAVAHLKKIYSTAQEYKDETGTYPKDFQNFADTSYLSEELIDGQESGYKFFIFTFPDGDEQKFMASAVPITGGVTGTKSFCITYKDVVKANHNGMMIDEYEKCLMCERLKE